MKTVKYKFKASDLSEQQIEKIFQMLAADIVFISEGGFLGNGKEITANEFVLNVLVNDHFVPAADCEPLEITDLDGLYESVNEYGNPYQWTADKRGIANKCWRKK